jgi:translation initiation factor IF-2
MKKVGTVTHWYDKIGVAVLKLNGALKKGDRVVIKKGDEEFEDTIASMQIDHKDVASAKKGDDAAVKLANHAREGAEVFLAE